MRRSPKTSVHRVSHRISRSAARSTVLAAAIAAGMGGIGQPIASGATFTWTGNASNTMWSANSIGVTNWAGNVIPTSGAATQLVFAGAINSFTTTNQDITSPFLLNSLVGGNGGFTHDGQPLRFVANGSVLPEIRMTAPYAQTFLRQVQIGADLTISGTAGAAEFNGGITDGGAGYRVSKSLTGGVSILGPSSFAGFDASAPGAASFSDSTIMLTAGPSQTALSVTGGARVNVQFGAELLASNDGATLIDGPAGTGLTVDHAHWLSGIDTNIGVNQTGSLLVHGGSAVAQNLTLGAGAGGAGTMRIDDGGAVTSYAGVLGKTSGAAGTAVVTGSSQWSTRFLGMGGDVPGQLGGSASLTVSGGAAVNVDAVTTFWAPGNVIDIDGGSFTTGGLADFEGAGGLVRVSNSADAIGLTVGAGDRSSTFTGQLVNGSSAGSMMKVGSGTLTLGGGSQDFVGNTLSSTYVTGGTLVLNKAELVASVGGSLTITGGSTVRLESSEQISNSTTVNLLDGTLDLNGHGEILRDLVGASGTTIRLGTDGTLIVNPLFGSTFSGTLDGPNGTLVKGGANTLTLNGNSTLERIAMNDFSNSGTIRFTGGTHVIREHLLGTAGLLVENGTISISNGADVDSRQASASIELSGAAIVSGSGSRWRAGALESDGTVTLSDHGTLQTATLTLGLNHAAFLNVQSGASLASGTTTLAAGAQSIANVTNPGSAWTMDQLTMGAAGQSGAAVLNVSDGASASVAGRIQFAAPGQTIDVNQGQLTVGALQQVGSGSGTIIISDSPAGPALTVGANDVSDVSFAGAIRNSTGGAGSIRKIGHGTLALTGSNNTYSGATIVDAGALIISRPAGLGTGTVVVNGSGRLELKAGMNAPPRAAAVAFTGNGKLDLYNNDFIVGKYTERNKVEADVNTARNGGAWNGPFGITSTAAAEHPSHATTIGVLGGDEWMNLTGTSTFGGQVIESDFKLLKYTYYGDTDFNGIVNFDDYVRTDNGFNNHKSGWLNGDFDLNGTVNFDDYVLIDLAFNTQSGTLGRALSFLDGSDRSSGDMTSPALRQVVDHFGEFGTSYARNFVASVPEPSSLIFAGVLTSAAMIRRRRRRHR